MLIFINVILLIVFLTIIFNKGNLKIKELFKNKYMQMLHKVENDIEFDYEKEFINNDVLIYVFWTFIFVLMHLIFIVQMLKYDIYVIPTFFIIFLNIYLISRKREKIQFKDMSKEKRIDYLNENIHKCCNGKLGISTYLDTIYLIYTLLILTKIIH